MIDTELSWFLSRNRDAIAVMRSYGIPSLQIAIIVNDIRSASLSDEFRRIQNLTLNNPPKHISCFAMEDAITEWTEENKHG